MMPLFRPPPRQSQPFVRTISTERHPTSHRLKSQPPPQVPVTWRPYNVALVGLGYRGYRSHFLSLLGNPRISITGVCDINRAALEAFSTKHQGIPTYHSLPQLLQSHNLDFAIVSIPHGAYMECITAIAAKGVSILKEKPIVESVAEYEWMSNLPVKIGVTLQKRFEPLLLQFRSLLPLVGDVAAVEAHLTLNIVNLEETWRASSGVGVTEDLGCHMLDLLVWLFGPPTSVMAHQVFSVRPSQRYGGDDVSDIMMNWGHKNCIGHVRLSRVAHTPAQFISVTGTNGTLSLDGHQVTHHDTQGRQTLNVEHQPTEKQVIRSMVQEFGDWVTGRRPNFSASLANVQHTVSVVDAIKNSLTSHQIQHPLLLSSTRVLGAASNRLMPNASTNRVSAATFSTSSFLKNRNRAFGLNTGASIPAVGLGTRRAERPGQVYEAVCAALGAGYRHIDMAQSSGNEREIGQAIRDSGVSRNRIWITTKLDNRWHTRVDEALELSLSALGMDYVDLYLMHWPVSTNPNDPATRLTNWDFVNTWEEMQKLQPHKVPNIGVSNFGITDLQRLLSNPSCKVVPAVNQIELHPYWPSRRLLTYCNNLGIHCTAYSCLGSTDSLLFRDPTVLEISQKKQKSPSQILYACSLSSLPSLLISIYSVL
ncbi:putative reductase 1 [Arthroderma uncinatum]|uniref:putative reductase 1 n=1 Tax=Arthroderma uncinatum TaxID=74035 RepID=UPI00144AEAE8|nr:putative reductase 1 [Arthroderma uncinatum]KAF3484331.1 putative reductase 1 [Arthroderma uncinatum]